MMSKKSYVLVLLSLLVIPFSITAYKYYFNRVAIDDIVPRDVYSVSLELDIADFPEKSYIKTYLPQNDHRQTISNRTCSGDTLKMRLDHSDAGVEVRWDLEGNEDVLYSYSYRVEGKEVRYHIPKNSSFESFLDPVLQKYLSSEPFIQSSHPRIDSLAHQLKRETLLSTLTANFDFVGSIQNSYTRVLTDAASVLELNRASCNGKSRLFTALCRAPGYTGKGSGRYHSRKYTKTNFSPLVRDLLCRQLDSF